MLDHVPRLRAGGEEVVTLQLREYQHLVVDHILKTPRCNLFVPMGAGKTVSTLTAIDLLTLTEDVLPVLVIAPLRVAQSTWPDEVEKWAHLQHLRVSVIVGDAAARRAALRKPADIYTINYENLPWLAEEVGADWPFRMVVTDEASKLKGFRLRQGSKRAQSLAKYAHSQVDRYVGLTGTPAPNGLVDLWGISWFLDKGQRLGRTFDSFKARWFQSIQVGADRNAVRLDPLPFAQTEIEDRLRDVCMTIDIKDWLDIDDPVVNKIRVTLPPKARRLYKEMERDMFMVLAGEEIEAFNAAAKTMKCLQLANGAVYTNDAGDWQEVHDEKIKALESVIEEASGMPVLVAYHFKSDLARLQRAFPQGRHLDKDPQTIRDWNDGKVPVLFAHPASAGHGISLQDGGNILAFFGLNWNLEEHMQIIERIGPTRQKQSGYDRPVFLHYIIAEGTVDELVMARLESKKSVQEILLAALKEVK